MSVSHNNSPYVTIYRVGSGNSVDITLNGAISSTGAIQGSKLDITGFTNLQGGANVQGLLNVQGTSTFVQTEGDSPGLRVQGRTGTQLFDVNVFEVVDSNGNVMLGANQGAGRRVSIIGGSGFWNTAALEVYTAESGGRGISIKGSSGQTADYMRVIDSSNNQLFSVSANGSVVSAAGLQGATLSLSGSATVSGSVTAGSMYSSGWFYSTGATGWYNSTYGGGMHMADSTWIRTYGSKTLYVESGLDTGGASGVGCGGGLGGGYTFRVCGSGNMTGGLTTASLTSSGGTTLAGDFWWGGSQSGIQGTVCVGVGNNVFRNNGGCSSSSIRFKENVTTLDDSALSLLGQLRPVSFDWKGDYDMTAADGGKHDFGVIAEEVQAVLPNLVTYDPEGRVNGVKYEGFIPFLIKAVQEQQSQIVQLQGGNPSFTSLTVNGPATVQSLTVRGDAHVKGDIYVEGHLVSRGSTPTVDTSLLSCVDGILVTGTDIAGAIQFEVDEASCTSADLRFVFAKEYSLAPNATLTAKDRGSARLDSSLDASTDKMTFSFDGLQTGKTYRFTYHVIQ